MFVCLFKYSEDEMIEKIASISCEISPATPLNHSDIIVQVRFDYGIEENTVNCSDNICISLL